MSNAGPRLDSDPSRQEAIRSLEGRIAVVTGGGSGIGLAVGEALADAGAVVTLAGLDAPETARAGLRFQPTDVRRGQDIEALAAAVPRPDLLVVSAGFGVHQQLATGDPARWAELLEVNLLGALRAVRAFVPAMLEAGHGDVVFVSSTAAAQAYPYGGVYAASKAALEMVAETLRLEVQPTVRVSVVAPGVVDTPFFGRIVGGTHTPESIGWGALSAQDVAEAVMFAVTRPPGVAVNHLVIRPAAQPM